MENQKPNRQRNTYFILIAAGVFLLVEKTIGFFSILGIVLIIFGALILRDRGEKKGYVMLGIGLLLVSGQHFTVIVALVLIALGYYFMKSKDLQSEGASVKRQNLIQSLKYDREPWVLRSMNIWHAIGETRLDLSLAIVEEKEVTVVLQGIIGDIDILIPEYIGVSVEGTVIFGQLDIASEKGAGVMNKISWQSANFPHAETKVKLIVSYLVGDIDVKVL